MLRKVVLNIIFLLFTGIGLFGQAPPITIDSIVASPVTCGGFSDGKITVYISGGSGGGYIYRLFEGIDSWSFPDTDTSFTYTGLKKSYTYTVMVADVNPAWTPVFVPAVSVLGPDPIIISGTTVTDIKCASEINGSIEVFASGEEGDLLYTLGQDGSGTNTDGKFNNLDEGTYTVIVSDNTLSCPSADTIIDLIITKPPLLTVTDDLITDVECYGDNTGAISITAAGGTPDGGPYTYVWTGPGITLPNAEDQVDLIAGDYQVKVIDDNLCEVNGGDYTVDEAAEILMTVNSSDSTTCFGDSDGKVNISVSNGTNPLSFLWEGQNPANTSTMRNANDLAADIYTLTIEDANPCIAVFTDVVQIFEPDPIAMTIDDVTDVLCFGDPTGSLDITISGGSGSYPTTTWTGPTPSILEDPVNLLAGTYSLQVIDSKLCSEDFTDTVIITQPNDITAVPGTTTDALCFGSGDGEATVTVADGTPGYSYLWTGINPLHTSTMPAPKDLFADTYDLKITDANSCEKIFDLNMVVGQPEEIEATIDVTDVLCNGFSTGEIDITPDKGTPPYTFAWTGTGIVPTAEDQTGLTAGFYNVTITDANLCTKDYNNIEVTENSLITASFLVTDLNCNSSGDGAIATTLGGGVAPFTYSWISVPAGYTNIIDEDISSLDAQDYILTVKDAENCEQTFPAQTVTQPDPLMAVFSSTDVTCYDSINGIIDIDITGGTGPYTTNWSNPLPYSSDEDLTDLPPAVYSLYLEDGNGCFINYPNEVTINEPTEISISETHNDMVCVGEENGDISVVASDGSPGYTFLWDGPDGFNETTADIINLKAGQYDLTVTDSHGCPKEFINVATIVQPDTIKVTIISQSTLDCFGDSDGSVDITTTGGVGPYSHVWRNSIGTIVSTLEDATGLSADTYSLEVTDASMCTVNFSDTITITEPTELTSSLSSDDVICYSESNGSITVTASGGTPGYNYSLNGAPPVGSNVFPGLSKGFYTVDTRDTKGCLSSGLIEVKEPAQVTFSDYGVSGQNDCYGDSSATIYINTVNGGIRPYEYSIDAGVTYQSDSIFPNIPGGTYHFMVRDKNLCETTISSNLKVDEPFEIKITNYTPVHVTTCYEDSLGQITLTASGGSGSLRFSNDGGVTTQGSPLFSNLLGGIYDLQIIDDNSCSKDTTVELNRPDKLVFSQADTVPVTGCYGDSNGEIVAAAIGGTPARQYSLDNITYQGNGNFSGLWASDTTVYVKDAQGCTKDTTVTITEPVPITFTLENAVDAGCNGASTGSVIVQASGGTVPYTYTLNPPVGPPVSQASGTFPDLPAGDYTVDVQDTPGCGPVTSIILTVGEPTAIVVDSVKTDFISCNNASDAEIRVYASGGTPPYQYSYNDEGLYEASSSKTGLNGGTYVVWVKDANGCTKPVGSYNFVNPAAISLNASLTPVSPCFGGANGAISALATGGWESFEYSIDGVNYQASGDFTGLTAGDYTIFTIDTGNCSSTINVSITEPAELTATITKTDYVDAVLGTITITDAAGGVPPYLYSIDGLLGSFTATTSYIDLVADSYDVVVRDDSLCTYEETIQIFDILPLNMVIDSADISCFGENDGYIEFQPQDAVGEVLYSIDNSTPSLTTARFENLAGNTMYILRAEDADGKVYWDSVFITEPPQLIVNSIPKRANCNLYSATGEIDLIPSGGTGGFTYNWSNGSTSEDLVNIVAGAYSVIVTDNSNCSVTEDIVVSYQSTMSADAGKDTSICQGETIILEGLAQATDIVIWDPVTYLSNPGISNPAAVNVTDSITYSYRITETTSGFYCYDIDTLTIAVLPNVGIDVTQDTVALKGQEIQLETTGGPFVSYSWFPTTGLDASDISDPIATGINSILYYVDGTNEYGCIETDSIYIEIIENITVYNAFSPNNGDDINQYFEIQNAAGFPQMLVEIFNRWGSRVFSSVGYSDDKRWDGTSRGKDVPIGTYYYIIVPYPDATPITGNVTIIR